MSLKYAKPEKRERLKLMYEAIAREDYEAAQKLSERPKIEKKHNFGGSKPYTPVGPLPEFDSTKLPSRARVVIYDDNLKSWWLVIKECKAYYQTSRTGKLKVDGLRYYDVKCFYEMRGIRGTKEELADEFGLTVSSIVTYCVNGRDGCKRAGVELHERAI